MKCARRRPRSPSPTLKAALDTFAAEARTSSEAARGQWLATIAHEVDKVARTEDADAIVLVDTHQKTIAAAGRKADRWPQGRPVALVGAGANADAFDGVAQMSGTTFRIVAVPLVLDDGSTIGTLCPRHQPRSAHADDLKQLSRAEVAIVNDGLMLASTLPRETAREFEAALAKAPTDNTVSLDGESYAFRRLVQVPPAAGFYALASIDEASRPALATVERDLALIATGAALLALLGSLWLAHLVTRPVGRLSASLRPWRRRARWTDGFLSPDRAASSTRSPTRSTR